MERQEPSDQQHLLSPGASGHHSPSTGSVSGGYGRWAGNKATRRSKQSEIPCVSPKIAPCPAIAPMQGLLPSLIIGPPLGRCKADFAKEVTEQNLSRIKSRRQRPTAQSQTPAVRTFSGDTSWGQKTRERGQMRSENRNNAIRTRPFQGSMTEMS